MNPQIATITLNPVIDQTASIPNFKAGEVNRVEWKQVDKKVSTGGIRACGRESLGASAGRAPVRRCEATRLGQLPAVGGLRKSDRPL